LQRVLVYHSIRNSESGTLISRSTERSVPGVILQEVSNIESSIKIIRVLIYDIYKFHIYYVTGVPDIIDIWLLYKSTKTISDLLGPSATDPRFVWVRENQRDCINNSMSEYSKLSKDELEELARKYGVELDRRLLKSKMVKQLEKHISSISKDELEEIAREDGVELDKRLTKEKLVEQVADISDEPQPSPDEITLEEKRAKLINLNF